MSIVRHDSAHALAEDVAGRLLTMLAAAQAEGRAPQVALTGGTIARVVHRAVAVAAADSEVDWGRVDFFWGDERYVDAASADRNAAQTREDLLDALGALGLPDARVHEMPALGAGTVDEAAAAYAAELRAVGAGEFDVVMLGMGPDGHVASLFPGFPQLDVEDEIAVGVTGSPKPPPERITLTFPALNRAREVWFLVSGEEKSAAVARALAPGGDVHETPARGVEGRQATLWFLDAPAASHLP